MAQVLPWMALGLSALALAHALMHLARAKAVPGADLKPFLIAGAALLAAGVLLTLPTGPPFSTGQALAPGFLLGGAAVLLSSLLSRPRTVTEPAAGERFRFLTAAAQIAAVTLGIGILLALNASRVWPFTTGAPILDALGGYSLGALTCGILLSAGPLLAGGDGSSRVGSGAETATLTAVALSAATYLATVHPDGLSPEGVRQWQAHPALLAAALAVALNVRGILATGAGSGRGRSLVVLVPLAVLCWVIGYALRGSPPRSADPAAAGFLRDHAFLIVTLAGFLVFLLIDWLGAGDPEAPAGRFRLRADLGLLAALLALAGAVLAFRTLHGYGLSLAVLAGLGVLTLLPARADAGEGERPLLRGALVLVLLLALTRWSVEFYGTEASFEPNFFYYYVGLVLGALLPLFLAGSAARWMEAAPAEGAPGRSTAALLRTGLAGLAAALAPLLLWLLVGDRPQNGFLVGLPIGAGFLLAAARPSAEGAGAARAEGALARLLALGMAAAAIQFTHLLGPLALLKREQRIGILAGLALVAVIAIAVTAVRERGGPRAAEG